MKNPIINPYKLIRAKVLIKFIFKKMKLATR